MSQTMESAAKITKISGEVYVERNGEKILLEQDSPIYETDKIITSADSGVQIQFNDGAIADLSPNSTLIVKDFAFGFGEDTSFILNLANGVMRSVSGDVVKEDPDAFRIVTPSATVGIRGTELLTMVLPDNEIHAVIHLGEGHTVVVTTFDGRQLILTASHQGVEINPDLSAPLMLELFTEEELTEFIDFSAQYLKSAMEDQAITDVSEGETINILLDESLLSQITSEQLAALEEIFANAGLEVSTESSLEDSDDLLDDSSESDDDDDDGDDGDDGDDDGDDADDSDDGEEIGTGSSTSHQPLNTNEEIEINGNLNYNITTSGGDDEITVKGDFTAGIISTGGGDDDIKIENNMSAGTAINAGDGENVVTIVGNLFGNISAGTGKDVVTIEGDANSAAIINVGSGENTVVIKGLLSGSVTTGSGVDKVEVENLNGTANISVGSGEDEVIIKTVSAGGADIDLGSDNVKDIIKIEALNGNNITIRNFVNGVDEIEINGTDYTTSGAAQTAHPSVNFA